jgi:hypothetical protein
MCVIKVLEYGKLLLTSFFQTNLTMESSKYTSPELEVVELYTEGGFCSSNEPLGENRGSWD